MAARRFAVLVAAGAVTIPLLGLSAPVQATVVPTVLVPPSASLSAPSGLATGVKSSLKATIAGTPDIGRRTVILQARQGTGVWKTAGQTVWGGVNGTSASISFTPPAAGAWQYRAMLPAVTGKAPAVTGATRSASVIASKLTAVTVVNPTLPARPWTAATLPWSSTFSVRVNALPAKAAYSRTVRMEYRKPGTTTWKLATTFRMPANASTATVRMPAIPLGKYQGRLVVVGTLGLAGVNSTSCPTTTDCLFTVTGGPVSSAKRTTRISITPSLLAVGSTIWNQYEVPGTSYGSVRFWDADVAWKDIETAPNVFNWTTLDAKIRAARALGQTIIYPFGYTPAFYAGLGGGKYPAAGQEKYYPPTKNGAAMTEYRRFIRLFLDRYDGPSATVIPNAVTAYQSGNEINLPSQWAGTAAQAAQMTGILDQELRAHGSTSVNAGASVALRRTQESPTVAGYLAGLRSYLRPDGSWPIDAWSGHLYPAFTPAIDGNVEDADKMIGMFQTLIRQAGGPAKPIWDTEMNYRTNPVPCPLVTNACDHTKYFDYKDSSDRVAYNNYLQQLSTITPAKDQVALTGQTVFRALDAGVERTYWYAWMPKAGSPNLGLEFWKGSATTSAIGAIFTWLGFGGANPAKYMDPCTVTTTLYACPIGYTDGSVKWVVWSRIADTATDMSTSNYDSLPVNIEIPGHTVTGISYLDNVEPGKGQVDARPALVTVAP